MTTAVCAQAQTRKVERAEKKYALLDYTEAVDLLEISYEKDTTDTHILRRLANAYKEMRQLEKAKSYFEKLDQLNGLTDMDHLNFGLIKKQLGEQQSAQENFEAFALKNFEDSRVNTLSKNAELVKSIEDQEQIHNVVPASFNTPLSEFGGYAYQDKVYILSSRKAQTAKRVVDGRNNEPFLDFFESTKIDSLYGAPKMASAEKNTKLHEGPLCFTSDGLRVYFTRNNTEKGDKRYDSKNIQRIKIYTAEVSESGEWNNIKELPFSSKHFSVAHPAISNDGETLFFVSDMDQGYGGSDIYRVDIHKDGTYGNPENLGPRINTEGNEVFPWVNAKKELFFSSDGHVGLGGLDVFTSKMERNGGYKFISNLGRPINSERDDFAFVPTDDATGFVSSDRTGGKGGDDIYIFNIAKEHLPGVKVEGKLTDEETGEGLAGAEVTVKDVDGYIAAVTQTDGEGNYEIMLDIDQTYMMLVELDEYASIVDEIITIDADDGVVIMRELDTGKATEAGIRLIVTDKETNEPLEGVLVVIYDKTIEKNFMRERTGFSGSLKKPLSGKRINDHLDMQVTLLREGYLTKSFNFSYDLHKAEEISLNEWLKVSMEKTEAGLDIRKALDLDAIYFDYNSAKIRNDAALILDQIVIALKDNPQLNIELASHTDAIGGDASNFLLSKKRAEASKEYLVSQGIVARRIVAKGYGETQIINRCKDDVDCFEEEHQQNRRTEFLIKD